nr:reverse transcriptase domain-containing protein [Tanacetum cinerariifolium]
TNTNVFKRLGSRGKSVSAHSDSHNWHSHSRYTGELSESEDSEVGIGSQDQKRRNQAERKTTCLNPGVWFDDLPPDSIDSYDDLKKAFLENYLQQKKYIKDPIELHNIKRRDGESTKDFLRRYKLESKDVKGAPECMRISMESDTLNSSSVFMTKSQKQEDEGTEGPMIIEAEIGGHCVHRMYVDGKSASEIMYEHCFSRLRPKIKKQLIPATTHLIGFSGDIIWPIGQIQLLVKIGDEEHSALAWMNFMIVRSQSLYNEIIGRPGVRKLQAVPSTVHGMLKIPVEGGVITLKSSKLVPLECSMVSGPVKTPSPTKPIAEERVKVAINPKYPEQTVMIGSTLTEEGRNKLCGLLQRNLDILSWKPTDMTGVPRHIAKHRLNVREGWRMCVDFKDLNKACPKDGYPLPEIDWKVNPLCGFPFKCFLDAYKGYHQIQMATEDEDKTAFITSQGIFWYTKVLFGLRNAGATYQRLVDKAFHKQISRNLEVYMDDLVIKSRTEDEIVRYVEEKFKTLREINMKLNPKKCAFGVEEGMFIRALRGPELNYTSKEKLVLALVHASKRQKSKLVPLECSMVSGPVKTPSPTKPIAEERVKVAINPEYPEQTVMIGSTLTEEGRNKLCGLLQRNLDILAWKPTDMTGVPRHIAKHRLNVREGWRMWVDFKDLNKACPKDGYPLPEIDWKVKPLCGFPFKCFLDAYKGYHQIQMATEDEDKTAFITSQGIFWYTKMLFGLRNARATYQRLVDKAFHKQISRNLEVYMDDLVIKSRTEDEIVRDVEETFKTLREINMKLNPKKCAFGVEEGMFIRYKVNAKGLKVCPDKVDAVLSLPSQKCLKDMQKLNEKLASLNRALRGPELNYKSKEKLVLALVHASKRQKRPRISVKGRILVDFIVERPKEGSPNTLMEEEVELPEPWILFTDGFDATNNEAEYEALIAGLRIAEQMGVKNLQANVDSRLVANQVNGTYVAKEADMIRYLEEVKALAGSFKAFSIKQILRRKSISEIEILAVVEEEGDTWMTPLFKYLVEETLLADVKKAREIKRKSWRFAVVNETLYKKIFSGAMAKMRRATPGQLCLDSLEKLSQIMENSSETIRSKIGVKNYVSANTSLSLNIRKPMASWKEQIAA